jgi:hypothetical protein
MSDSAPVLDTPQLLIAVEELAKRVKVVDNLHQPCLTPTHGCNDVGQGHILVVI